MHSVLVIRYVYAGEIKICLLYIYISVFYTAFKKIVDKISIIFYCRYKRVHYATDEY